MNILYVEDIKQNADLLAFIARTLDEVEVVIAPTGKEGLACYQDLKPELVFLDINLPDMSGIEVCREIKTLSPEQRVYALSAKAFEQDIDEAMNAGFDGYITKPIDIQKVISVIEQSR